MDEQAGRNDVNEVDCLTNALCWFECVADVLKYGASDLMIDEAGWFDGKRTCSLCKTVWLSSREKTFSEDEAGWLIDGCEAGWSDGMVKA